jgi:WD40 repeat protein
MPSTGKIFISYRRSDTEGYAGRIFDRLGVRFGRQNIFMDVDTIQPGENFVEAIEKAVSSCDVLIALIGDEWLTTTDEDGRRRLDNPNDFVRVETATALKRDIRVIPVLLAGTEMPNEQELPEALQPLAKLNALEIRHGSFDPGIEKLESTIDTCLREVRASQGPLFQRVPVWAWIGIFGLILVISSTLFFRSKLGERSIVQPGITETVISSEPGEDDESNSLSTSLNIDSTDPENTEGNLAVFSSEDTLTPEPSLTATPTPIEVTSTPSSTPEEAIPSETPNQDADEQPENETLVVNSPIPGNLMTISANNAISIREVARWEIQKPIFGMAHSPSGDQIALGLDLEARILNAKTGEQEFQLINPDTIHGKIRNLAFNRDGNQIVLVPEFSNQGDHVQTWDLIDGQYQFAYNVSPRNDVTGFAMSPKGELCAIGLRAWTTRIRGCFPTSIYVGQTGEHTNGAWVLALGFSPSETYLATGGGYGDSTIGPRGDGRVRLWSSQGAVLSSIPLEKMLLSLEFSPVDDDLLAVSSDVGTIDLLEIMIVDQVPRLNLKSSLNSTGFPIQTFAFSPDGEILAAGNEAGEIFIWRIADGSPLTSFEGHDNGIIWALQFSPDGSQLVSVSDDTTVRVWGIPHE